MKNKTLITTIALVIFLKAGAQEWLPRIDSSISVLSKRGQFAGQVLLAEGGRIVFSKACGIMSGDGGEITTSTMLDIASISKTFTAASVMLLAERGRLNYDDELNKYLPEIPYKGITIRNILNHTSGLPNIQGRIFHELKPDRFYTNADIMKLVVKHHPPCSFAPGSKFEYSNLGYELLALIIEKVSGTSYTAFVRKKILEPLGMKHTFHFSENKELQSSIKEITIDSYGLMTIGADNYYSTVSDLFKWDQSFYADKILKKETIELINSQPIFENGDKGRWGLGWNIQDVNKETMIWQHMGEGVRSTSVLTRYIGTKKTYIFIHTGARHYAYDTFVAVKNIWEGKPFRLPEVRVIHKVDINLLPNYVGDYGENGFMHLTLENGRLYIQPDGAPGREELVPSSDSTFYFVDQPLQWQVFKNKSGHVLGFGPLGQRENMMVKQNGKDR